MVVASLVAFAFSVSRTSHVPELPHIAKVSDSSRSVASKVDYLINLLMLAVVWKRGLGAI